MLAGVAARKSKHPPDGLWQACKPVSPVCATPGGRKDQPCVLLVNGLNSHCRPKVIARAVDVADRQALDAAATEVREALGRCDLLFANVGVQQLSLLEHFTDDDWRWMLSVNLMGTIATVFTSRVCRSGRLRTEELARATPSISSRIVSA